MDTRKVKSPYSRDEDEGSEAVEAVAYPEEVVDAPIVPEPEKVEDRGEDKTAQSDEMVYSFVVKQLDEFVKLQVMTSTVNGQKYLVIPHMYFNMKPEEIVLLDDSALVPFNTAPKYE